MTAYIAITINAIFTVSPTCRELNSFIPKKFKVNQLGIGVQQAFRVGIEGGKVTLRRLGVLIGLSGLGMIPDYEISSIKIIRRPDSCNSIFAHYIRSLLGKRSHKP